MLTLNRTLNLVPLLHEKSFFLFGPRATGKSTLITTQLLPDARVYDLLDHRTFSRLLKAPHLLEEDNLARPTTTIVIDEIQKLPSLLDEVHRLIHHHQWRFLLTGSSARKLKRGGANLLAGRAWRADLFPLTSHEIPNFDLETYLNRGGLPHVYLSNSPQEELENYLSLYLKEEIQAESLTRNLPAFSRFLDVIALANGEELNIDSLASDCAVSAGTVKNYLDILEDTLIGFSLKGFTQTKKRKATSRLKHYLFDIGVTNTLANRGQIKPKSELFGNAFEHFIIGEVRAYLSYARMRDELTYWRSQSHIEVDLVIGNRLALEIKSSDSVSDKHLKGLRALKEEGLIKHFAVVSLDSTRRVTTDGITIYPFQDFLSALWGNVLLA